MQIVFSDRHSLPVSFCPVMITWVSLRVCVWQWGFAQETPRGSFSLWMIHWLYQGQRLYNSTAPPVTDTSLSLCKQIADNSGFCKKKKKKATLPVRGVTQMFVLESLWSGHQSNKMFQDSYKKISFLQCFSCTIFDATDNESFFFQTWRPAKSRFIPDMDSSWLLVRVTSLFRF